MRETQQPLARWIIIVTSLFALLEISVSLSLAFVPATFLDDVDLNAKGVGYLIKMWAIRQFALGIILAFAAFIRSSDMLKLSWIFMLVMFIGDLVLGLWQQNNSLIISAIVMSIIAAGMLLMISKRR